MPHAGNASAGPTAVTTAGQTLTINSTNEKAALAAFAFYKSYKALPYSPNALQVNNIIIDNKTLMQQRYVPINPLVRVQAPMTIFAISPRNGVGGLRDGARKLNFCCRFSIHLRNVSQRRRLPRQ